MGCFLVTDKVPNVMQTDGNALEIGMPPKNYTKKIKPTNGISARWFGNK